MNHSKIPTLATLLLHNLPSATHPPLPSARRFFNEARQCYFEMKTKKEPYFSILSSLILCVLCMYYIIIYDGVCQCLIILQLVIIVINFVILLLLLLCILLLPLFYFLVFTLKYISRNSVTLQRCFYLWANLFNFCQALIMGLAIFFSICVKNKHCTVESVARPPWHTDPREMTTFPPLSAISSQSETLYSKVGFV